MKRLLAIVLVVSCLMVSSLCQAISQDLGPFCISLDDYGDLFELNLNNNGIVYGVWHYGPSSPTAVLGTFDLPLFTITSYLIDLGFTEMIIFNFSNRTCDLWFMNGTNPPSLEIDDQGWSYVIGPCDFPVSTNY